MLHYKNFILKKYSKWKRYFYVYRITRLMFQKIVSKLKIIKMKVTNRL